MFATVERIDDSPPVASELFEGARHVFLDADGERIRVLIYQTATNDDAIHLATPDAGLDGTWQPQGACTRLERVERGSYDRRGGLARVCSVFRSVDPVVRRRVHDDHDRPDRDAAVHYASIDQLILFCIVIFKWVRESVSGNVGETRRAGDHVCTTPMPAAELQPRLRPRSRTAADRRVGVNGRRWREPGELEARRQHRPLLHGYGWTPGR